MRDEVVRDLVFALSVSLHKDYSKVEPSVLGILNAVLKRMQWLPPALGDATKGIKSGFKQEPLAKAFISALLSRFVPLLASGSWSLDQLIAAGKG